MSSAILDVGEKFLTDESIKSLNYVEYKPIVGSRLNTPGNIEIIIENTDDFYYPHRSWLLIQGQLVKNDGTAYADADMVALTNNGIMHLFTNINYQLNGRVIENLNHPGHATTLLNTIKNTSTFNKSFGLAQCWQPDTSTAADNDNNGFTVRQSYIIKKPNPKGTFSFIIPLDSIFGFCEDYTKVIYGMRHTLSLSRSTNDNDAIFRSNAANLAGKVKLNRISLLIPRVLPNDAEKYKLYKTIESVKTLDFGFRIRQCSMIEVAQNTAMTWRLGLQSVSEKPRWVIVGLQTDKINDQTKNSSLFNHCNVTNMSVTLNNVKYPMLDANADFNKFQFMPFYKSLMDFNQSFYGVDPLVGSANINPVSFQELTPIFVFDVTKQSERLDTGVVDMSIEMQFKENVPANTRAYALVINDRKWQLQSDGRNMTIQY